MPGHTLAVVAVLAAACGAGASRETVIAISASSVGAEGRVLRVQLDRFMAEHPGVRVEIHPTPDGADQRHQLYVQWLNAGARDPDVMQLDVIWTAELAAAGWLLPLDGFAPDAAAFFPAAIRADTWRGALYAVPWFADVGMLYYRTDLVPRAPATFDELVAFAAEARRVHGVDGFVWQGARYEGLACVFLEQLGARGGAILDDAGAVTLDSAAAVDALSALRRLVESGVSPAETLGFTEEQVRLAFQGGRAAFMRNWPYALALVDDPRESKVAGRVAVAPMPAAPGGRPTAALGGGQLAINARTEHPEAAWRLVAFLTAPAQQRERAAIAGQYPTRPALYDGDELAAALRAPPHLVRAIVEAGVPRPVTPVYAELSQRLQIELHRALTGQAEPRAALAAAAAGARAILERSPPRASPLPYAVAAAAAILLGLVLAWRRRAPPSTPLERREARAAWTLVAPAVIAVLAVAVFPLGWTIWESLHAHDLRAPWTGRPFAGAANYAEALGDARFRAAVLQTLFFTAAALVLELVLGLAAALALDRRGRGPLRALVLLPWALPTVVAALVWRFLFEGRSGLVNAALVGAGVLDEPLAWFARAATAWVPVILADVWKTTPFVALLLLAGLQGIDPALHEAARVDGAGRWRRLWHVTLPLLRPTILVAALFRGLDAFRVFDLIYVMTGGGPGSATESLSLYAHATLLTSLRFGYGSAISVATFLGAFAVALIFVRGVDRS